jgi:hypothetical protein
MPSPLEPRRLPRKTLGLVALALGAALALAARGGARPASDAPPGSGPARTASAPASEARPATGPPAPPASAATSRGPATPPAPPAPPERPAAPGTAPASNVAAAPAPPPPADLERAAAGLSIAPEKLARIREALRAFEAEVPLYEGLPERERLEVLRLRSLDVLDELRVEVGASEVNHLMSLEALRPIYRHSHAARPTVYPPPRPDRP